MAPSKMMLDIQLLRHPIMDILFRGLQQTIITGIPKYIR